GAIPQLVGRLYSNAVADRDVRQLELRLGRQDDPLALGMPGMIVDQSIKVDTPVAPGSAVLTRVATGVEVPMVVQASLDTARQRLAAAGLRSRLDPSGGLE